LAVPRTSPPREREECDAALRRAASQRLLQEGPPHEYAKLTAHASSVLEQLLSLARQHMGGSSGTGASVRAASAASSTGDGGGGLLHRLSQPGQPRRGSAGAAGSAEGAQPAPWVLVVLQKLKDMLKESDRCECVLREGGVGAQGESQGPAKWMLVATHPHNCLCYDGLRPP
jgi:hypothetical protein